MHYAKVENNMVTQVIVAEHGFFDRFVDSSAGEWVQTSYSDSLRKNYAGVGFSYDSIRDAFIPPQPFPSWTLIEATCQWEAPTAYPSPDGMYTWNETTTAWEAYNV